MKWFDNLTKRMKIIIISSLIIILLSIIIIPVVVINLNKSYSVTSIGTKDENHLVYVLPKDELGNIKRANNKEDYKISFNIDYQYELQLDDIHVYINNKEELSSWSFMYQTNVKNYLTISKEYINGDIKIEAIARKRTSTQSKYGYEIGPELDEYGLNVTFKVGDNKLEVNKEYIEQLKALAYPVLEDDTIEVTITKTNIEESKKDRQNEIFHRLWFRTNARYAKIYNPNETEYDFKRTYSEDDTKCIIEVPHFIIRDNGSIRENPNAKI